MATLLHTCVRCFQRDLTRVQHSHSSGLRHVQYVERVQECALLTYNGHNATTALGHTYDFEGRGEDAPLLHRDVSAFRCTDEVVCRHDDAAAPCPGSEERCQLVVSAQRCLGGAVFPLLRTRREPLLGEVLVAALVDVVAVAHLMGAIRLYELGHLLVLQQLLSQKEREIVGLGALLGTLNDFFSRYTHKR